MLVSVVIGLLNEEKFLPRLIEDFKNQTYDHSKIELIFIDGMSKDKSWEILEDFKVSNHDFYDVVLLENPKVILSAGMNVGIKAARGECILKVDCHSHITENFIENEDNLSKTLLLVEENMFGSGIANYRKQTSKRYVSSVFQGMYKKEIFDKIGLLDEKVGRVEDNELHYRIRKNGYKIRYSNDILSYQYTRPTVNRMLKQKYSNGYWIGKVSHVYPKAFSIFHFVPFVFVLGIIFSLLMLSFTKLFAVLLAVAYGLFTILVTLMTIINNKFNVTMLLIPILLFLVHFSYGLGTLVGLVKGFSWKKEYYKE